MHEYLRNFWQFLRITKLSRIGVDEAGFVVCQHQQWKKIRYYALLQRPLYIWMFVYEKFNHEINNTNPEHIHNSNPLMSAILAPRAITPLTSQFRPIMKRLTMLCILARQCHCHRRHYYRALTTYLDIIHIHTAIIRIRIVFGNGYGI